MDCRQGLALFHASAKSAEKEFRSRRAPQDVGAGGATRKKLPKLRTHAVARRGLLAGALVLSRAEAMRGSTARLGLNSKTSRAWEYLHGPSADTRLFPL